MGQISERPLGKEPHKECHYHVQKEIRQMGTNLSIWSEEMLIQQIGSDNDRPVVVLAPLWDMFGRKENVSEGFKGKNLTCGDDSVVPNEIAPQGWGVDDQGKEKRDEPSPASQR
jgi:hypothetical protein